MRKLLSIAILLIASQAWAVNHYVDCDADPGGDGTIETPWDAVADVHEHALVGGDNVYFKRGCTFPNTNALYVGGSGDPGNPVTFTNYSSGALPVLDMSVAVTSWTENDPVAGVYSDNTYSGRYRLWEDNVALVVATTSSCTDGNWYTSGGKTYYKPTTGVPGDHDVRVHSYANLYLNNKDNITIDGLAFTKFMYAIFADGLADPPTASDNIIVKNSYFYNGMNAVFLGVTGATMYNSLVDNNTFEYVGTGAYCGGGGDSSPDGIPAIVVDNCVISNNTMTNCCTPYGYTAEYVVDGGGTDCEGFSGQNVINSEWHHNSVSGICRGVYNYIHPDSASHDLKIRHNYIDTTRFGIMTGGYGYDNAVEYNNEIYSNIILSTGELEDGGRNAGLVLSPTASVTGTINKIYNNTIDGNEANIYLLSGGDNVLYYEIKNNILSNPTGISGSAGLADHFFQYMADPGEYLDIDYNLYYPASSSSNFYQGSGKTFAQWKALTPNRDANSVVGDPSFVSASDFNLQLGSPAINAGVDMGITTDYEGTTIPQGMGYDIGAYEFPLGASTYYVDQTGGDDGNTGLATDDAWKTIAKVNGETFSAGDSILFKRGEIWREQLTVPSSGSSDSPITFGSYGSGNLPIISGADLVTTWTADGQSNTWNATVTTQPYTVIFDNTWGGRPVANKAAVNSANEWFWADNVLSVYSTSDPDDAYVAPGMQVGKRDRAFSSTWKDYITVDAMEFQAGNHQNNPTVMFEFESGGVGYSPIIKNSVIKNGGGHGVQVSGYADGATVTNGLIDNNTISAMGNMGINSYIANATQGNETIISNNDISDWFLEAVNVRSNWHIIENNTVHDGGDLTQVGGGIHLYSGSVGENSGDNNIVRYNLVYEVRGHLYDGYGISADQWCDNAVISYNVVYNTDGPGIYGYDAGLLSILNNTVYNASMDTAADGQERGGIRLTGSESDLQNNTVIKNNICYLTSSGSYPVYVDAETYNNTLTIMNNIWYRPSGNWYFWNATGGATLATWNALTGVGNDLNSDPLFVSTVTPDFRLLAGSPGVNAGVGVDLTTDYVGTTIVGLPDIGAYESAQTPSAPKNLSTFPGMR